jgi:hypothetical protein
MELPDRDKIEASFAARFSRLNSRLRHKLEDYLGSPPDIRNVPDSFWQEAQDEANRELAAVLMLIWGASAKQHGLDAGLATQQAARYAEDRAATFARDFAASTRTSAGKLMADFQPGMSLQRGLVSVLGPDRAARIATTETTRAQTAGGEAGIGQTVGLSGEDIWRTRRDARVCPICDELDGQPRAVWQAQFPTGPGDDVHPQCRCWIRYSPVPAAI